MVDTHYRAFISYSHRDREAGEHLHKKLEHYRVPTKLVGALTKEGSVPRRLTPIFRDREDLPTSGDLTASVEQALERSRFLIVLCSPASAKSEWVDKEIARFKTLHGEGRVLGVILDNHDTAHVTDSETLFPPSLRFRVGADGATTDEPVELLAADLRESGDGEKFGFLKIVAGLIGVHLDDLVMRDQNQRNTEMKAMTGAALSIAVVLSVLTWFAVDARNEARLQRNQAEELVEFMLTDLKEKLETVGRLDALDSTGEKLLDYYAAQNKKSLDADSLGRRARAQLLVGDIDQRRNDLSSALEAYEAAAATTQELLNREPNNQNRIFEHAQSVFWVGYIALERRDNEAAEKQFLEYLRLSAKLVSLDGNNPDWRMEVAYATSALGSLKYNEGDYDAAVAYFEQSTDAWRTLSGPGANEDAIAFDLAHSLSWLAVAERERGAFERVVSIIEEQLGIYELLMQSRADDIQILELMSYAHRRLAEAKVSTGNLRGAELAIENASSFADSLLAREEKNARWKTNAVRVKILHSTLYRFRNDKLMEIERANDAVTIAKEVMSMDDKDIDARNAMAEALSRRVLAGGESSEIRTAAASLSQLFNQALISGAQETDEIVGVAGYALAEFEAKKGDRERSNYYARSAYEQLAESEKSPSTATRFTTLRLCRVLEKGDQCREIAAQLEESGYKHPEFASLQ
jgi:tetratricopeptide (TPR) repeat protein